MDYTPTKIFSLNSRALYNFVYILGYWILEAQSISSVPSEFVVLLYARRVVLSLEQYVNSRALAAT